MRTIIFSTKEEAEPIRKLLGGEIFEFIEDLPKMLNGLYDNENAIVILTNIRMTEGWTIYYPASVLFSSDFTKDKSTRTKAEARVRYSPRLKDWGE